MTSGNRQATAGLTSANLQQLINKNILHISTSAGGLTLNTTPPTVAAATGPATSSSGNGGSIY